MICPPAIITWPHGTKETRISYPASVRVVFGWWRSFENCIVRRIFLSPSMSEKPSRRWVQVNGKNQVCRWTGPPLKREKNSQATLEVVVGLAKERENGVEKHLRVFKMPTERTNSLPLFRMVLQPFHTWRKLRAVRRLRYRF